MNLLVFIKNASLRGVLVQNLPFILRAFLETLFSVSPIGHCIFCFNYGRRKTNIKIFHLSYLCLFLEYVYLIHFQLFSFVKIMSNITYSFFINNL